MATATKEKPKMSKGTVSIELLKKYLPILLKIVERKTTIPILTNFRLHGGAISATDLDVSITLDGVLKGDVDACVPAHLFGKLIDRLDSDVRIAVGNEWQCEVLSDSSLRAKMQCLAPGNFPSFPAAPAKWERVNAQHFLAMARKILCSISREDSRYTLNAALCETVDGTFRMVATDGHRMGICETTSADTAKQRKLLLSREVLALLVEAIPLTGADHLLMTADEHNVHYRIGPLTAHQRAAHGQFPDWQNLMKGTDKWPFSITVNAAEIVEVLRTAALFSDPRSHGVRFVVKGGKLTILAHDVEHGECSIDFPAEMANPEDITIGFNADYLIDFFSNVRDEATMSFKDSLSMGVFRATNENYQYIAMPMRF